MIYTDLRRQGYLTPERGKAKILATQSDVERGWRDTALILAAGGDQELAERVQRFVDQMPRPKTGSEMLLQGALASAPTRKIEPDARTR
jgi:hypothetical protein